MAKRKPTPKKDRFEVFKRDSFTCQYCGKKPPEVTLEIDHIVAVADGGTNELNNLITACFDCNRGKSKIPLDKLPNTLAQNYEILQEREVQLKEYHKLLRKIEKRKDDEVLKIESVMREYYPTAGFGEKFCLTVKRFIDNLGYVDVADAMRLTCDTIGYRMRGYEPDEQLPSISKYFCGICWNKIRNK